MNASPYFPRRKRSGYRPVIKVWGAVSPLMERIAVDDPFREDLDSKPSKVLIFLYFLML
jgi:hypothetical protein